MKHLHSGLSATVVSYLFTRKLIMNVFKPHGGRPTKMEIIHFCSKEMFVWFSGDTI